MTRIKVQLERHVPKSLYTMTKMVAISEKAKEQSDNQSIETENIMFWNCIQVIWSIEVFSFFQLSDEKEKNVLQKYK